MWIIEFIEIVVNRNINIFEWFYEVMYKTISLSDEAYRRLMTIKGEKTFSEVIIELMGVEKKKRNIMEFVGIWKDDSEYWDNFEKEVYADRKRVKLRDINLG